MEMAERENHLFQLVSSFFYVSFAWMVAWDPHFQLLLVSEENRNVPIKKMRLLNIQMHFNFMVKVIIELCTICAIIYLFLARKHRNDCLFKVFLDGKCAFNLKAEVSPNYTKKLTLKAEDKKTFQRKVHFCFLQKF